MANVMQMRTFLVLKQFFVKPFLKHFLNNLCAIEPIDLCNSCLSCFSWFWSVAKPGF
jgi:hypothetical protein